MSNNTSRLVVFRSLAVVGLLIIALASTAPAYAASRTEVSMGGGLILIVPFGHMEVRQYVTDHLSASAFASMSHLSGSISILDTSSDYSMTFANIGSEVRYHPLPTSILDPHVGLGVGYLIAGENGNTSAAPWGWLNAGLTVHAGSHLRLDLEVNPVIAQSQNQDMQVTAIPIARLRWVF